MTKPRATLAACSGAHTLHDGLTDALYVLLPIMAQMFGLNYAQVGLIRTASRTATAAFQLPAGVLAETHGERRLLVIGTAFAGIGFVLLGLASGFAEILIAVAIAGFGAAFQHPLCSSMISRAYALDGRRIALGTYNFMGDVGKVAVAGLFGVLATAGLGWQGPAIGLGIFALAGAALLWIILGRTGAGERPAARTHSAHSAQRTAWGIRNRGGFAALCAIEIVDASARNGFLTFVAFLMLAKGMPTAWAMLAVPLVAGGGMAGKLACGFLAERYGPVRTIAITQAAAAACIAAIIYLPGVTAYLLLPVAGIALNGTSSALYGTVGDLVDSERVARAFGLFYTLGSSCGVVAPLVYGLLADQVGVHDTMLTIAAITAACLPLTYLLKRRLAG
jgi:MFS family permease